MPGLPAGARKRARRVPLPGPSPSRESPPGLFAGVVELRPTPLSRPRSPDRRSRGRYLGGTVPFGFTVGPAGELMEVAEQQSAILTMRELRRQGLSLRAIAAAVARQHRIEISHAGVAKVLASPRGRAPSLAIRAHDEPAFGPNGELTVRKVEETVAS